MRIITLRRLLIGLAALFLLPLTARTVVYSLEDHPASFRAANWDSVGMLPNAAADHDARLLIFTGRTARWKGIFSVHSWVVFKTEGATAWIRYDLVGWGQPIRKNAWAPDARWYGDAPRVVIDVKGAAAQALIPAVERAIADYRYRNHGDYRMWPGPNSNTFVAAILSAVPALATTLPPNAIGKDFRNGFYAGQTDSRTGVELSLSGVVGIKLGWIEGVELNMLGLVAGLDLRHPALKLPGFGRVGVDNGSALAAPTVAR